MTATTIIVSAAGGGGMVSSSQQIQNYNLFAVTSSANTFYGNQTISGGNLTAGGLISTTDVRSNSGASDGQVVLSNMGGTYYGGGTYYAGDNGSSQSGFRTGLSYASSTTKYVIERSTNTQSYGALPTALTYTPAVSVALATGDVTISTGNLIFSNGKGIDFSATANSGSTTPSELLNDYEEGTFTPILTFNGSSVSMTYSQQYGTYTKIGRHVTISLRIILTNKGSSTGTARIESLPFTIANINGNFGGFVLAFADGMSSFSETLMFVGDANSNYINLRYINGSNYVNFSNSNFTNTSDFIVTGTYQAS
jgi:hypothetical protein